MGSPRSSLKNVKIHCAPRNERNFASFYYFFTASGVRWGKVRPADILEVLCFSERGKIIRFAVCPPGDREPDNPPVEARVRPAGFPFLEGGDFSGLKVLLHKFAKKEHFFLVPWIKKKRFDISRQSLKIKSRRFLKQILFQLRLILDKDVLF